MTGSATVNGLGDRRIALFDPAQCLADHSGKGGDLSFSGERHGRAGTVFQGVPMAFGRPASGSMREQTQWPRGGRLPL